MNIDSQVSGWLAAILAMEPNMVGAVGMSSGRLGALGAIVIALIGVSVGGFALRRKGDASGNRLRRRALVALMAGLVSVALGGVIAARAPGGVGTGNGFGGAMLAVILGGVATILSALVLRRARFPGAGANTTREAS